MLARRLFRFGFETPVDAKWNASEGTDYESTTGVWIISESDEDALRWGRIIAERLVGFLFDTAGVDAYLWTEASFAHWIEQDSDALSAAAYLPVVDMGEMPDLAVLAADAA